VEAGVKYLVLAAASSGVLLFGMALVYAVTGSLDFATLAQLSMGHPDGHRLFMAGVALIVAGAGFKLAIAPFHFWTPDVYEGAPAPSTAFVATVSKGGIIAVLLRFFSQVPIVRGSAIFWTLACMAVASMFIGNWLALFQNNVKRLLAYSSIAHLGYLVVAFLAAPALSAPAVALYAAAYMLTSLGTFGVVTALSGPDQEAQEIDDYIGLAWRRPGIAAVFTIMLLSLAGLPLTAGFIGKFLILTAGWGSTLYCLSLILIVNSVISAYYYLRLVFALFSDGEVKAGHSPALISSAVLAALALIVLWIGIYPAPFLQIIRNSVGGLF
jgi:NADH-quinone oxidoreductase subunit N